MFYVLNDIENPSIDEDEYDDPPFLEVHEELLVNPDGGWHSGKKLAKPPENIIQVQATPLFGYEGAPPDYYDDSISLISPRLKNILLDVGVDNVEFFPVHITYRDRKESYDWFAFNIVGLSHSLIDNDKAHTNENGKGLIDSSINGFSIDEHESKGLKIFRLSDNVMTTVVTQEVKDAVDSAGINTFAFTKPEDWIMV
ncbi:imm11 family protein [Alkalimarinus sediminis]|uniref:Immunity MXAN-0049 protein domain-containing protein n=1 Tax=Alkalimarinus sediminis TaxID=1632866 RepID=A0A9E8KKN0_9ALTE|nr:DUF1629 domain-containing protein [Alkalimarinus sediminis]UZW76341.1 hypothetical protein NNL22_07080 [Alkalimarinus sediminis]